MKMNFLGDTSPNIKEALQPIIEWTGNYDTCMHWGTYC